MWTPTLKKQPSLFGASISLAKSSGPITMPAHSSLSQQALPIPYTPTPEAALRLSAQPIYLKFLSLKASPVFKLFTQAPQKLRQWVLNTLATLTDWLQFPLTLALPRLKAIQLGLPASQSVKPLNIKAHINEVPPTEAELSALSLETIFPHLSWPGASAKPTPTLEQASQADAPPETPPKANPAVQKLPLPKGISPIILHNVNNPRLIHIAQENHHLNQSLNQLINNYFANQAEPKSV